MNSADEFDPLADLLGKHAGDQADAALRESAFAQTLPVLRRRRLIRRAGRVAAFAGCYLAGLTTMGV